MCWEWNHGDLPYLYLPDWQERGVQTGFSSRNGGVSQGAYSSLNLGLHVGDSQEDVLRNRERWFSQFGAAWSDVVVGEQVHSSRVVWVGQNDAGRGANSLETSVPQVDGLLTRSSLGLLAFFADCVPLFFYHPVLEAVGIAHAGWKGTVGKIALRMVEALAEQGGRPEDLWVALGPSIGACCYEVDEPLAERFRADFTEISFLRPTRPGHYSLDLWQANQIVLREAGVPDAQISVAGLCTACHQDSFFSHRRDGIPTGRMAAWIRLIGKGES